MQPMILQLQIDIVYYMGYTIVCATNMQLLMYKMDKCYKKNGLR
jgi:hypothetical protein